MITPPGLLKMPYEKVRREFYSRRPLMPFILRRGACKAHVLADTCASIYAASIYYGRLLGR